MKESILKSVEKIPKWLLTLVVIFILISSFGIKEFSEISALKEKLRTATDEISLLKGDLAKASDEVSNLKDRETKIAKTIDEIQSLVKCSDYPLQGEANQKLNALLTCFKQGAKIEERKVSPEVSVEKEQEIPTYSIGDEVIAGDLKWKVVRAKNRGNILRSSESRDPEWTEDKVTEGKFIEIEIRVENIGREIHYYDHPKIYDDKGREFSYVIGVHEWIPENKECIAFTEIKPGFSPLTCIKIYEVAKNSKSLWLYIESTNWGEKGAYVYLGNY